MIDLDGALKVGGVAVSFIGFAFLMKFQIERLKEEDVKQWASISKLRDWASEHEKDSAKTRLEIEREFGKSREDFNKAMAKMDNVVSMMTDIKERFNNLEEKIDDLKGA